MGQRAKGMASHLKLTLCAKYWDNGLCDITMMHDAETGYKAAAAAAPAAAAERWLAPGLLMSSSENLNCCKRICFVEGCCHLSD